MLYRISKTFRFEAAHYLQHLPPEHPCHNTHGHSYRVKLTLAADGLTDNHWVRDYRDLDAFKRWVDNTLDHRNLNNVCPYPTTAECLARWIFEYWHRFIPELVEVTVYETESTEATYRGVPS
jgi:6-pyruvoyltetrahydropterin/6-carboxytetrahydropterin synthase